MVEGGGVKKSSGFQPTACAEWQQKRQYLNTSMLSSVLRILVVLCLQFHVMSKLLLIVNSIKSSEDARRFRLDESTLQTWTMKNLQQYLADNVLHISIAEFSLEIQVPSTGKYERREDNYELDVTGHFLSVLVNYHNRNDEIVAAIKGRRYDLSDGLQLRDGIRLYSRDAHQAELGTGLNTWDGAVVLAKYFQYNPSLVMGKRILEVGSGTGLSGIAAGLLGAAAVLLTDLDYTLENLRENVRINSKTSYPNNQTTAAAAAADLNMICKVEKLDWCDKSTYPIGHEHAPWDLVIGADVVWLEHLVPPLVQTLFSCMGVRRGII